MVFSPPNEIYVQNVGDTVKLNCSAGGAPLPRVKWLRDGKRVYSTAVFHEHNLITSELVIHGFQQRDVAIYKCIFCMKRMWQRKPAQVWVYINRILVHVTVKGSY